MTSRFPTVCLVAGVATAHNSFTTNWIGSELYHSYPCVVNAAGTSAASDLVAESFLKPSVVLANGKMVPHVEFNDWEFDGCVLMAVESAEFEDVEASLGRYFQVAQQALVDFKFELPTGMLTEKVGQFGYTLPAAGKTALLAACQQTGCWLLLPERRETCQLSQSNQ